MDKPKCKICGERHWGACKPQAAKLAEPYGKPGFEVAAEALGITEPAFNPVKSGAAELPQLAPPGECRYCDRRRAKTAEAVRLHRIRKAPVILP